MPICANDFRTHVIQIGVFARSPESISQPQILQPVLSKYSSIFDAGIAAFPVPPDAPGEIPRVIMSSRDGAWRIQGSPTRVDCFWSLIQESDYLVTEQVFEKALEVICAVVKESNINIGRCALVLTRLVERADPGRELVERFCSPEARRGALRRSDNFEIHNHKKYQLTVAPGQALSINSWVRCKTATTIAGNRPLVLVEQDLNTLEEELRTRAFPAESLKNFFTSAHSEATDILKVYFPEQGAS